MHNRLRFRVRSAIERASPSWAKVIASDARRRLRLAQDRVGGYFLAQLVVRTVQELKDDDASHMAAGVAYYSLFSLFPLLLGLTTIMSFFVESEEVRTDLTDFVAEYLPGSGELMTHNLDVVVRLRGALGIFSVLGLLWSASAVFGAIARAVNRAWDVHRDLPVYISMPRQILMAFGVGIVFAASLGAATVARIATRAAENDTFDVTFVFETLGRLFLQGVSFGLTLAIFLAIYKFMPNTKTYWRYIWPGAIVGALMFEAAKSMFLLYVDSFSNFENVYGSLAPVIALLVWVYVSSFILILGAELSSEYGRLKNEVERGTLLHPTGRHQLPPRSARVR